MEKSCNRCLCCGSKLITWHNSEKLFVGMCPNMGCVEGGITYRLLEYKPEIIFKIELTDDTNSISYP